MATWGGGSCFGSPKKCTTVYKGTTPKNNTLSIKKDPPQELQYLNNQLESNLKYYICKEARACSTTLIQEQQQSLNNFKRYKDLKSKIIL
jgi:hypothetical protein